MDRGSRRASEQRDLHVEIFYGGCLNKKINVEISFLYLYIKCSKE